MKPKSFSTPSERSNFYKELFSLAVPIGLQNLLVALIGASDALMGANGSAYSTVVVELVALVWCIAESHRGENIRPDWQGFKWFSAAVTKDWFRISLPMLGSPWHGASVFPCIP